MPRARSCANARLFVLTMFIGVSSPDYIETWEAAVLLGIYVCYIGVAYSSDYLEKIAAARFPVFAKREPTQGQPLPVPRQCVFRAAQATWAAQRTRVPFPAEAEADARPPPAPPIHHARARYSNIFSLNEPPR